MARPDPSAGARLAAAVGPRLTPPGADPPTVPLLFTAPRRPAADATSGAVDRTRLPDARTPPAGAAPPGRVARLLGAVVPAGWRGARVDPGRPGATALALVAALAAVVAAVGVWTERPRAEPVAALPGVVVTTEAPSEASAVPSSEAAPVPAGPLVVAVSGKVARPGLVEGPDGSRVADALAAAGGALPGTDLSGVNLARRVVDGEQIAVGVPPAPDAAGPAPDRSAPGSGATPQGPVDLNAATEAQLDALPGVGPVTARRILEWRERNGRFSRVEQLREVEGIGERRFAQLRELVVVA
ncbi:helix-hairpin-helix domain-containing protein [Pseudonocardia sp.]|uniref:ComEA family DNA-binding protein n=1 Tax=Pseudonocardia sp. TaxID=60912 RepID=UPI00262E10F3|nr:helix-hairpin-helix domain-containing protein [Pseudonocardia sp.]